MKARVGISSWAYPWAIGVPGYPLPQNPLTPLGLLSKVRPLGAEIVQIADNLPLDRLTDGELSELREAAEEQGIALEAGTRGVQPEHLLRYLNIAQRLGAKILRTLTHTADSKPELEQVETWLREVLPAFEDSGVTIALENNEAHQARELAWLMREIDSPCLGICLDTANSLGRPEDLEQVVEELAPYTVVLHVKDFDVLRIDSRMGFSIVGRPAGEGRVDLDWVFEQLARCGRHPSVILELWPPFTETTEKTVRMEEEWVARSMRFLKAKAQKV